MNRKIIFAILALVLCFSLATGASAATEMDLYDEADLLTGAEEMRLAQKLAEIGEAYDAQIVIVTVPTVDSADIDWYLENLYDSMGFGYGPDHDGVLLLVCMDVREYRILSNGYAAVAIDTGDIAGIGDAIVSELSEGDYAAAFDRFADECAYYLNGYRNGFPFETGTVLITSLVVGILTGVIVAIVLRGQLKTVRKQNGAGSYVKADSMRLDVHNDLFLYRNVSRVRKQTNNTSGGSRSSGSSRSIGGGRF